MIQFTPNQRQYILIAPENSFRAILLRRRAINNRQSTIVPGALRRRDW
jgi:hypothetical protein